MLNERVVNRRLILFIGFPAIAEFCDSRSTAKIYPRLVVAGDGTIPALTGGEDVRRLRLRLSTVERISDRKLGYL